MQRLCSDEMYSHCTYKIIASGNSSHSEPANCPNFINSTQDPSSPCSNCLAWLLHHRLLGKANTVSLQGSCRHGPPSHTCRLLSTGGVTMLPKRQASPREQSLTWRETLGLNCLASFPAGHTVGSPGSRPSTRHSAGALTPLAALQHRKRIAEAWVQNRMDIPQFSSPQHTVFETLESVQELLSQPCSSTGSQQQDWCRILPKTHRRATSCLHSLGVLLSVRRMGNKPGLDLKF